MNRVIVIGAGASGMMAAITAARQGAVVTVLEKMEKPGKKLLITGNGRCNLTNKNMQITDAYRGRDTVFAQKIIEQFPVADTLRFFHELGLLTRDRDGYIYPYNDQAAAVAEILLQEMQRLRVKMKYREQVTDILKTAEGFTVKTATWQYPCDRVILCTGGKAAPQTGSSGDGYVLAQKCGHKLIPVVPALVPLKASGPLPRQLSGTRNTVRLKLETDGREACRAEGELQWTDYGVSGIVVFQVSRYAAKALCQKKKVQMQIDLMPEYTEEALVRLLTDKQKRFPKQGTAELLAGMLKKKNIEALCKIAGKQPPPDDFESYAATIAKNIKRLTLEITGTKDFDMAQVCAGGVPASEVCPDTLESLKMPGLYLAGELLDIDGICGGYNLQWAWSSGYVAGIHAVSTRN